LEPRQAIEVLVQRNHKRRVRKMTMISLRS
jgi:hypothetical protein